MNWKLWVVSVWFSALIGIIRSQTCQMEIRDQFWRHQWYLKRTTGYRYDMNVMPAWESCVNGTGIQVAVVDKGVDQSHEDLYNSPGHRYWYDYSADQVRLKHGTRVAGIIGAKKNDIGIIGIAFGAEIRDIQIASTSVFESFIERKLFSLSIDVFSCSFANFHTGTKTYPLSAIQEKVFSAGTKDGRDGRGSVYVFATGNSGGDESSLFTDSCAYDRLVTNRYVISVAGIQHNLQKIPNGEACSAMMVAAFTAKGGEQTHRIVTTDVDSRYTFNFNQNSAAAPMVSGAVALALSANSNLTYRDIMHLLVETSRSDLQNAVYKSSFTRNAANFPVSSYFGFGLLDIGALVERSKTWDNVPPRIECSQTVQFNAPLQQNNNNFIVNVASCSATYIEHVEVTLNVNHENAGRIQWVLVSPYGTRSKILPGRALDTTKTMNTTVLTVQMWGENPNGFWRLEPTPVFERKLDDGVLESVEIKVHGYRCSTGKCLSPARQESGTWSLWGSWSQCSSSCGTGIRSRRRTCGGISHTVYCEGSDIQALPCQQNPCPAETPPEREGERLGVWSSWSRCSRLCGYGIESRSRTNNCSSLERCDDVVEERPCYLASCRNEIYQREREHFYVWSSWSTCSKTCGFGRRTRSRKTNCRTRERCADEIETRVCYPRSCQYEIYRCYDTYAYCASYKHFYGCRRSILSQCRRTCQQC